LNRNYIRLSILALDEGDNVCAEFDRSLRELTDGK